MKETENREIIHTAAKAATAEAITVITTTDEAKVKNDVVEAKFLRSIKSFARRRGQGLSKQQEEQWQRLWPLFGLECDLIDPQAIFGRQAETILEIGFGNGSSLLQMAANFKEKNFIGIEVYRKGISELLVGIEKLKLTNIRIICGDAAEILETIPDGKLSGVQIFFADPWPKTRHHKRRLIQNRFVTRVALKLKPEGYFHLATDWEDYAQHMMSVISNNDQFENISGANQFSSRPTYRPITKYEQRGYRLGHPSWDLIFKRCGS